MDDIVLDVRHVSKTFPVKTGMFSNSAGVVHAVNDVSFNVRRGETFGLVGESGCGKSTLSRTLLRLVSADSGEVYFNGQDILHVSESEMQKLRVGMRMVFQKPFNSLNPRQTVRQIIAAPFEVHKNFSYQEKEKQVLSLMDRVGLSRSYLDRYPHEFSGGQRQRIGIARALALHPELIICDEPVSALDVSIQAQILNLLKDLQQEFNLTYIFISHNLSVVKHMSDRIAVMYLGSIVEIADSQGLYKHARHPYTQALLSAIPSMDGANSRERIVLKGEIPSPVDLPTGCSFHTRCNHVMECCCKHQPDFRSMEDGSRVACFLYEEGGR